MSSMTIPMFRAATRETWHILKQSGGPTLVAFCGYVRVASLAVQLPGGSHAVMPVPAPTFERTCKRCLRVWEA